MKKSILSLKENIKSIRGKNKKIINELFRVEEGIGKLILTESMISWVKQTFGTTRAVERQKIVKVINRYTLESSVFNELRAKRPLQTVRTDSSKVIESSIGDSFCYPKEKTPRDSFGRVSNRFGGISASNITKYDIHHGLIIFKEHNPLKVGVMNLASYILLAKEWIYQAYATDSEAVYPFILWNNLWKAGASIVHGHLQVVMGKGMHYSYAEKLRNVNSHYKRKMKEDYITDLIKAHKALGLSKEISKDTHLFASITPRKEKEIWIVKERKQKSIEDLDEELSMIIAKALRAYITRLGVESFNMGIILPPLDNSWGKFPIIIRIIDRGSLYHSTNDIGGMELIAETSVISSDPYKVIDKMDIK